MTFKKKRAFHCGGASWLLLCAMADGAMAQEAAAPVSSTQLPEITVTAPSPIVRRKPAPSRTPARVARAAPAVQAALNDADGAIAATLAAPQVHSETAQQQPSGPDTDRHSADCAICAVLSLANNFMFATPPLLELPQAVELLQLTTGAEFAHLGSLHPAFQSRAPPVS